jgi:hypothetical protein
MSEKRFAREALAQIPKILTLLDRNPHSPTYGCFDRNHWHYKIIDFPSGMAQEFVLPLALAYTCDAPDNPYRGEESLRQWTAAGLRFAARSAHPDGSCDDYYPFERAVGAAAFSLVAGAAACSELSLEDGGILGFLEKRADWLANREESGRLSNHHALIVLALELLSARLDTRKWEAEKEKRLLKILSWQSSEGWFPEYEGCDPGYHTLTVSALAWYQNLTGDDRLTGPLDRAVDLAAEFVHPDGSFGGEYTSRNTYNFFPHGFELIGRRNPKALQVNDLFLKGLECGLAPCYADDHIVGHHAWNYLLAARDFVTERPQPMERPEGRVHLEEAGLLIDRRAGTELYLALNKGGVFKLFKDGELAASDTQFSLRVRRGKKIRNAVGHLTGPCDREIGEDEIAVRGRLGWAKQAQMTPLKLMILRVLMLTAGRFFPNAVRWLLQRLLIVGSKATPYEFRRTLRWTGASWRAEDVLNAPSWDDVLEAGIGPDQTSIYVVMSRTFQRGQMRPWLDLTEEVRGLPPERPLTVRRDL